MSGNSNDGKMLEVNCPKCNGDMLHCTKIPEISFSSIFSLSFVCVKCGYEGILRVARNRHDILEIIIA